MTFFKVLLAIDIVVAAIVLYFFSAGVADGTVSSFNIYLWLEILSCVGAVLIGGLVLKAYGHNRMAKGVLTLLAVPSMSYVLFFLILIISNPRWN